MGKLLFLTFLQETNLKAIFIILFFYKKKNPQQAEGFKEQKIKGKSLKCSVNLRNYWTKRIITANIAKQLATKVDPRIVPKPAAAAGTTARIDVFAE